VKEFVVYTLLRLVVLVATFAIIAGIWIAIAGSLNWVLAILLAFIVSGLLSFKLLNGPRTAFAARVEERAARTVNAFEEMKAKEDQES
jgi:hypothetical protein